MRERLQRDKPDSDVLERERCRRRGGDSPKHPASIDGPLPGPLPWPDQLAQLPVPGSRHATDRIGDTDRHLFAPSRCKPLRRGVPVRLHVQRKESCVHARWVDRCNYCADLRTSVHELRRTTVFTDTFQFRMQRRKPLPLRHFHTRQCVAVWKGAGTASAQSCAGPVRISAFPAV